MEFIFKPEKLTEDLSYEVCAAISKRAELASRKKFPALWEKTDALIRTKFRKKPFKKENSAESFMGYSLSEREFFSLFPAL